MQTAVCVVAQVSIGHCSSGYHLFLQLLAAQLIIVFQVLKPIIGRESREQHAYSDRQCHAGDRSCPQQRLHTQTYIFLIT